MNNDMYVNLSKKVKELRVKNGLTQEQVAEALNVTPGYISNVENNRSAMTLRMLIYYANLTHVSLDHLIGSIETSYQTTALDNELLQLMEELSDTEKEKIITTIKLWLLN